MEENFVFYDTETSGTDTRFDQVFQFAGIKTDADFNELESIDIRSNIQPWVLPAPHALRVTNIYPANLENSENTYYKMVRIVHRKLTNWGPAIFAGYNSMNFDEEIMRQAFWQNLMSPYVTNTRGSKRIDIRIILEAAVAINPDVIIRPLNENGKPSHRLEIIAPANGFEGHDAHDALGDVRATIFIAKLLKERMPQLWARMMSNADVKQVTTLAKKPDLTLTTHFGEPAVHRVTPVAIHPQNNKQVLMFDLSEDPTKYLDMTTDEIVKALGEDFKILRTVKLNSQPALYLTGDYIAPKSDVDDETAQNRRELIENHPSFKQNAKDALKIRTDNFENRPEIEDSIYGGGFPSKKDEQLMGTFHNTRMWSDKVKLIDQFEDKRFRDFACRIIYSHTPYYLSDEDRNNIETNLIAERWNRQDDVPWNSIKQIEIQLDEMKDHEMSGEIKSWIQKRVEKFVPEMA